MSASTTTPANIIQQDEKNPRGIPKALFIVRSSAHAAPASRRLALSPFAERRGGVCRRPRGGCRTGHRRIPGCPSVRIALLRYPFPLSLVLIMCGDVLQEIPLYGQQPDTAETWARREDPRDQKNVEHGRVFTRSTGALIFLSILFYIFLTIGSPFSPGG